ncbi:MAG: hypothetical protein FJ091_14875 [Deltaproteobacteria bacterium]|nr:hypothetical protein [Deltaproteobacteria bacterium]
MTRMLGLALAIGAAAACMAPPASSAAGPPAQARELVYFPRGDCETETIELELYDRASAAWIPHPEHPRLTTGQCVALDASSLLNELRLRCIDPAGKAPPSDWITGFEVAHGDPCSNRSSQAANAQATS